MAKTSMIEREKRREKLVKQHAVKRAKLREIISSPKSTDDEREDAQRKLQYDLFYVKNHSLALDIQVLVETIRVVLFGEGAQ